jgi:transcriptional regulator with XRE-family HTH domain
MPAELGQRLRAARLAQGLSLRTVAADASVSPSLLSQVETGKVHPSVSTLYAIVTRLGVSLDEILDNKPVPGGRGRPRTGDPVQRDAAPLVVMENGVTWQRLAIMDTADDVVAVLATYEAGAASSIDGSHMRHDGVEYGYVIDGELTLKIDFDTYPLRTGDSFCFDSRRPHFYVNNTDRVAKGIWYVVGSGQQTVPPRGGSVRTAADMLDVMNRTPRQATLAAPVSAHPSELR